MKKLLSLLIATVLVISAFAAFGVSSSAAQADTLVITDEGRVLAEVKVGDVFIYRVGLCAGDYTVVAGQGTVKYDSDYVQVVNYGTDSKGRPSMYAYSFPESIRNSSLVCNFDGDNEILYNYSKYRGVGTFTDVEQHYFKIRFKAVAAGTVEIHHTMEVLSSMVGSRVVKLYYNGKPNEQLDTVPYTLSSAEPSAAYIGDANGDFQLTILDATFIQKMSAGLYCEYNKLNCDVNEDDEVTLRDAVLILKHNAGYDTDTAIGEWVFTSEL